MLTLRKLLNPDVQDVCPNCGTFCPPADVLCSNCGKNLDELFDQLPESTIDQETPWIPQALANPRVLRLWILANSVVLLISLFTPWIVYYSDNILGRIRLQYLFGFHLLVSPVVAFLTQGVSPLREFLPTFGIYLISAIAPALATHHALGSMRKALNLQTIEGAAKLGSIGNILRLIFAGASVTAIGSGVGFNSYVSLGYFLALAGVVSSLCAEIALLILGKLQVRNRAA
jgi:hypothetical protein